jgi:hypothetical protein
MAVSFGKIYGPYHYGRYGNNEIIIDITNGYVNATKLCKQVNTANGNPKRFREWTVIGKSIEIRQILSRKLGVSYDSLTRDDVNVPNDLKGTYVHPKLVFHIAYWTSTEFGVIVGDIIDEYMAKIDNIRNTITFDSLQEELLYVISSHRKLNPLIISSRDNSDRKVLCVYFIRSGNHIKIGVSGNLSRRFQTIQSYNPTSLKLIVAVLTFDAYGWEAIFHEKYRDVRLRMRQSEWFEISDEDAFECVREIKDYYST